MPMFYCAVLLAGYAVGSIPFGALIAKAKGSGNPGATNIKRVLGKKYGNLVFCLDFLKGFLPVFIAKIYFQSHLNLANNVGSLLLLGLILGHSFSLFLKFHGGKGVATTIGGLAILMPGVTFLGIILWYSVFAITHFVSLASLCFALSLPFNAYLFAHQRETIYLAFSLMVIIFLRHISNICRLWKGTENRFNGQNNRSIP